MKLKEIRNMWVRICMSEQVVFPFMLFGCIMMIVLQKWVSYGILLSVFLQRYFAFYTIKKLGWNYSQS